MSIEQHGWRGLREEKDEEGLGGGEDWMRKRLREDYWGRRIMNEED